MSDAGQPPGREARIEAAVTRVARPARWLARFLAFSTGVAVAMAALLWWFGFRDDLDEGVAEPLLAAVILLVPAGWLLWARFALAALADLPGTVHGLARRGSEHLRSRPSPPDGPAGVAGAARTVYGTVRDAGEILASRALVAQLAAPTFWLFTALALLAVPLLALCAFGLAVFDLFS